MVAPAIKEQLALMLALQNLEIPLSSEECDALERAGQNLIMYPEEW